ncbi:hypothetical protein HYW74_03620 [Candidatus Pacearchaeota archaeon]|nr:hypothetical protein [Candidatus Pacearchaeota archaeon]
MPEHYNSNIIQIQESKFWRLDHKVAEILSPQIPEKVDFFQEYDSISLNFLKDLRKIRDQYLPDIA